MTTNASAEENGEFRVGMEAGYALLTGHRKMTHMAQCLFKATLLCAGGYDVQISKKLPMV